eukprot:TRINITY_DN1644_c0_g1_i3.p1 TRINITY_DN1644_c0_g1~~TRINITY_DN1644_c0_g1_i3.p1  ORF type:complete len:170 (+),score=20.40 TRINITY_DN1644_c0_g1_i3:327-836(+)
MGLRRVPTLYNSAATSFPPLSSRTHSTYSQDSYLSSYFATQRDVIFHSVELMIYLFDVGNKGPELEEDLRTYRQSLQALRDHSRDARIFCLIHKMDLIPPQQRSQVFTARETELKQLSLPFNITCLSTSIWDDTLFKAPKNLVPLFLPLFPTPGDDCVGHRPGHTLYTL